MFEGVAIHDQIRQEVFSLEKQKQSDSLCSNSDHCGTCRPLGARIVHSFWRQGLLREGNG